MKLIVNRDGCSPSWLVTDQICDICAGNCQDQVESVNTRCKWKPGGNLWKWIYLPAKQMNDKRTVNKNVHVQFFELNVNVKENFLINMAYFETLVGIKQWPLDRMTAMTQITSHNQCTSRAHVIMIYRSIHINSTRP